MGFFKRQIPPPAPLLFILVLWTTAAGCGITGYGVRGVTPEGPVFHTVKSGESIEAISKRYQVPTDTLVLLNGLRSGESVAPGRELLVSYGGSRGAPLLRTFRSTNSNIPVGGKLLWPVGGGKLASRFGPRSGSFHDGLDISAPTGTPVYAAHTGTVLYADNKLGGYGNLVILRGDDDLITVYAHNQKLLVKPKQRVRRGELIAKVGSTGRSTGPHLHFEVRTKDSRQRMVAVDPWPLLAAGNNPPPRFRVNESLTPLLLPSVR